MKPASVALCCYGGAVGDCQNTGCVYRRDRLEALRTSRQNGTEYGDELRILTARTCGLTAPIPREATHQ